MNAATTLRAARRRAGLSQSELALRSATAQTAISAYENGRKEPSLGTLTRLLAAAGTQLSVTHADAPREPSELQLARNARTLLQVLALAEQLPRRHAAVLRFPRISAR